MHKPALKLVSLNRMDARAQRLETRKGCRKRLRAILSSGIRDRPKSKRGSSGRTLQETAPRGLNSRIQIWFVHSREEVYLAQAQVVKNNEKLATDKKKGQSCLRPVRNRNSMPPNSKADSTSSDPS